MRCTLLLIALCLASPAADACRAALWKPLQQLDRYKYAFTGDVVGVRLDDVIEASLRMGDDADLEHEDPQQWPYDGINLWSDATPQHTVEVLPTRPIKGKPPRRLSVSAGGCNFREARIRARGLFFVREDGRADVVYEDEERYAALLEQTVECVAGGCSGPPPNTGPGGP
jgi:hypothetical protein